MSTTLRGTLYELKRDGWCTEKHTFVLFYNLFFQLLSYLFLFHLNVLVSNSLVLPMHSNGPRLWNRNHHHRHGREPHRSSPRLVVTLKISDLCCSCVVLFYFT